MQLAKAREIAGTLSKPSKMPCHGYSIPAALCKVGSKLAQQEGTPCSKCYAKKGRYVFPNVQKALVKRYLGTRHPDWVSAMVTQIAKTGDQYFRWHDSGDLQDEQHLMNIIKIAEQMPKVQFWLPTLETSIVNKVRSTTDIPSNLTIRLSSTKIGHPMAQRHDLPTSSIASDHPDKQYFVCPAPTQGNQCRDCRACWSKDVKHVQYIGH